MQTIFFKVVRRQDERLLSAITSDIEAEYLPGVPARGVDRVQHKASVFAYLCPMFVPGLFAFSSVEAAWKFKKQWGDRREVWECEGELVEKLDGGIVILDRVVLKKQIKQELS